MYKVSVHEFEFKNPVKFRYASKELPKVGEVIHHPKQPKYEIREVSEPSEAPDPDIYFIDIVVYDAE